MRRACLVVNPVYQNSGIFDAKSPLNRDDCLVFFRQLQGQLRALGFDLQTQDRHSLAESELVIYNDMPRVCPPLEYASKSHLLIFESHLIRAKNWNRRRHRAFRTVLTWNDDWVDNKKYFKFNFSFQIPRKIDHSSFTRPKLVGAIVGAHVTFHPLELYSERIKTIRWFEKNHPDQFALYGRGWDLVAFAGPIPVRMLNYIPGLRRLYTPKATSWKGPVENKIATYGEFRFAVCYENAEKIKGYITEKIFDCFFAGVVPIYWGAPNIAEVVPENCYIDRRKFPTHEDLYQYLAAMTEAEYTIRLKAIDDFLKSGKIDPFRAEIVAAQVASVVTGGPPKL